MLQEFGTLTKKYGAQPGACDTAFKATCPWDSAGLTSIVMKLMVDILTFYTDFNLFFFRQLKEQPLAELALKAASAASDASKS